MDGGIIVLKPSTKGLAVKKRIWINFKELRSKLRFEDVLRHYNVQVNRKGEQHQGVCPLPVHQGRGTSATFSANLERGIFQCFGCGAKGNVLEFAGLMTGIDIADGNALRSIAVELQQRFFPEGASTRTNQVTPKTVEPPKAVPVLVNAPLDFELKGLDHGHPYLLGRGFSTTTMSYFGVGVCARGLLKGRVAIPLHDQTGKLLGYAGRVIDDAPIMADNPRYVFPSRRERNGTIYEVRTSLFVYNGFRIKAPVDDLIVVQGFTSVWWLNQCGFVHSVALMGDECSEEQTQAIAALVKPSGRIWLVPNEDEAGQRLADSVVSRLAPHRFVRRIRLNGARELTDLTAEQLRRRLA